MPKQCPLCEKPASAHTVIRMGASWSDTFGKPPHSLFDRYMMVHVATVPSGERIAFLHTESDLQDSPLP